MQGHVWNAELREHARQELSTLASSHEYDAERKGRRLLAGQLGFVRAVHVGEIRAYLDLLARRMVQQMYKVGLPHVRRDERVQLRE